MSNSLKRLQDQIIVITGASSGIGLCTARMAARKGARLVLSSRNEDALRQLEQEIRSNGTEIARITADVGDRDNVQRIADVARERFGGFDTWVNNAGISTYGRIEDVPIEDHRRVFETNFWGVVYGSLAALPTLKQRGGALINIGSTLSDRAIPVQGMYSASKHAVKGFTDALRMELEAEGAPISVTLIKPSGIDTPYTQHAKNFMPNEATLPPPVYAPETVARAILHAATHPERDIFVGAGGKMFQLMEKIAPRLTDYYMEKTMFHQQQKPDRPDPGIEPNALYSPGNDMEERGDYEGHVMSTSMYTEATTHPWITGAVLGAAGLALATLYAAAKEDER